MVFLPHRAHALPIRHGMARAACAVFVGLLPLDLAARDLTLQMTWSEPAKAGSELVIGFQSDDGQAGEGYRELLDSGATSATVTLRDVPRQITRLQPGLIERGQIVKSALAQRLTPATEDTPFVLNQIDALRYSELWACDDDTRFTLIRTETDLLIQRGQEELRLTPSPLNPARFADEDGRGLRLIANRAVLTRPDENRALCAPLPSPPLQPLSAQGAPQRGSDLPGWSALLSNSELQLTDPRSEAAPPSPAPALPAKFSRLEDGGLRITTDQGTLDIEQRLCRIGDEMTPYPFAANLQVADRDSAPQPGCAGNPAALLHGGIWHVQSLFGQAIEESGGQRPDLTTEFIDDQIAGRSACNRYVGTVTQQGSRISFDRLAITRLACPEELAGLERRFLDALEQVTSFDISADGTLVLFAGQSPVMAAQR